jgi:hypothetical protein
MSGEYYFFPCPSVDSVAIGCVNIRLKKHHTCAVISRSHVMKGRL